MIGLLASFLGGSTGKAWGMIIIGIALAGYIGTLKFQNWRLENKVSELEIVAKQLELDVQHAKGETKACKARIEETNKRINDLKEDSQDRKEILDMLAGNLDTFRELSESRIRDIENAPTPQSCEEAMEFLRKGVRGR